MTIGRIEQIRALVAAVRAEFAPDPRLAIFEIDIKVEEDVLLLAGATSEPAAAEALSRRAALLEGWSEVRERVVRLPELEVNGHAHAVVTAAVAPMLAAPMIVEPLVSQVVLGRRLLVLRQAQRWLQCRSPEGYLGWVHCGYVVRMDEREARAWEVGTEGEACLSLGAELRAPDDEVMARLPWGARAVRQHDGAARLPDGRVGRVVGELVPLAECPLRFPTDGEAVARTALRWLGAPYLWSGVTPAGVDCSGFVQALLRLHGVELPRDSDQQADIGAQVDPGPDFGRLRVGDLCFFAEDARRVTHVALSLGGSAIIHSSLGNGGVFRNDLAGSLPYERELRDLFVVARRVL
ncbi:MAG: C40 family peptidase [Gemmatimonadetes bacterium]|nr:C40 family peptidase [Gemmatimonadota bacterium]